MKVLTLACTLVMLSQNPLGDWTRYVFEDYGFRIEGSQEFVRTDYEADEHGVRTIAYTENYKGADVVSYVSMYQLGAYRDVPQGKERAEILETALEDLAASLRHEVIYDNVLHLTTHDEIRFRSNSISSGKALKGRFVLYKDRMYLIAMSYVPSARLNKRSNYFIESFQLL